MKLYYLNARFYDGKIARFMQEDACLGNGADPLSLNRYTYCRNNPLIYWDPSGHVGVPIRTINEAEGNTVNWKAGSSQGNSTIVITTPGGISQTLLEGRDYIIGSDNTARYTDNNSFNNDNGSNNNSGGNNNDNSYYDDYYNSSSSNNSNSNNNTANKPTDAQYKEIAQGLGLSTTPDSPYIDIVETLLGIGGFASVSVSINNGDASLYYNQGIREAKW